MGEYNVSGRNSEKKVKPVYSHITAVVILAVSVVARERKRVFHVAVKSTSNEPLTCEGQKLNGRMKSMNVVILGVG